MTSRLHKKPKGSYHHPDLEQALVQAAVRTIREEGVAALTLRGVGAELGVSRTALYRHFADKAALLARVALEGFTRFRAALRGAVDHAVAHGLDPLEEMGVAYVAFALDNPSHYQTMFGGVIANWEQYPDLVVEADAAFDVLASTIAAEQRAGRVAAEENTLQLAHSIWANVHGLATLAMGGYLGESGFEDLARFSARMFREGMSPDIGGASVNARAISASADRRAPTVEHRSQQPD